MIFVAARWPLLSEMKALDHAHFLRHSQAIKAKGANDLCQRRMTADFDLMSPLSRRRLHSQDTLMNDFPIKEAEKKRGKYLHDYGTVEVAYCLSCHPSVLI